MKRIFDDESVKELISDMDDKELCDFTMNYKDGVHMATPVFDGAKEDEIKTLLTEAGREYNGADNTS